MQASGEDGENVVQVMLLSRQLMVFLPCLEGLLRLSCDFCQLCFNMVIVELHEVSGQVRVCKETKNSLLIYLRKEMQSRTGIKLMSPWRTNLFAAAKHVLKYIQAS